MTIEEWAERGFRIAIFPVVHLGKHEWTAGVRVGKNDKLTWMPHKDDGCTFSSFTSYHRALEAALKFCESYKPTKSNG